MLGGGKRSASSPSGSGVALAGLSCTCRALIGIWEAAEIAQPCSAARSPSNLLALANSAAVHSLNC